MTTPMVRVRRSARLRATGSGRYPSSSTALSTARRFSSLTRGEFCRTSDTRDFDTPARAATVRIVGFGPFPDLTGYSDTLDASFPKQAIYLPTIYAAFQKREFMVSKLAVRDFIKRLNRDRGVTVILTTHDMDDIETLCSRVIVIGNGKILSDGTLADLRARVSRERWLTVDLADDAAIEDPDATLVRRDGARVCLAFDPQIVSPAEMIRRVTSRHAIRDLFVENPPIETIVARLYETT